MKTPRRYKTVAIVTPILRFLRDHVLRRFFHAKGKSLCASGKVRAGMPAGEPGYSLPMRARRRSSQTFSAASRTMALLIFERPSARSVKMIGISLIRKPLRQAR